MGLSRSKEEPKTIKENNSLPDRFFLFIQMSFVGNSQEAQKALGFIDLPEDSPAFQIALFVKNITSSKNKLRHNKIKEIKETVNKCMDLPSLEKMQSFDDILDHLKTQFNTVCKEAFYLNDPRVQVFKNVAWLIKSFVNTSQHILSEGKVELGLKKQGSTIPDVQVYELMSEFHTVIKTFGSFLNVRRIFDGEVDLEYLTAPFTQKYYMNKPIDSFFGFSALKFKEDFVHILEKVRLFFKLWRYLYTNFLSNPAFIQLSPDQRQKFQAKVDELNQLTNNKLSHRSEEPEPKPEPEPESAQQISMNVVRKKPQPENQTILNLTKSIDELTASNTKLKDQIIAKDKKIDQLEPLLKKQELENTNLLKQLQEKNREIAELRKPALPIGKPSKENLEKQLQMKRQHEQEIKRLNQQWEKQRSEHIETVQSSLSKFQNQVQSLLHERKTGSTTTSVRNDERISNKKLILEDLVKSVDKTIKQVTSQITKYTKRQQVLIEDLQEQIRQFKTKIESQLKTIDNYQSTNKMLGKTNDDLRQNSQKFKKELEYFQQKSKTQIQNITQELKRKDSQIQQFRNKLIGKQAQIDKAQKQIEDLNKTVKKNQTLHQKAIEQKQNEIRQINRQLDNLTFEYKKRSQDLEKMTIALKSVGRCYTQYFNGSILNIKQKEHQEWFVQTLEACTRKKIKATYPVYKYDKQNKTPFSNYIDNKPQIVLIVKINHGQIIAGYSEPPFKPKTNVDYREGFLFAFKNRKFFTLKREPTIKGNKTLPKPITYDEYFIMWGNSDIRIKSGTEELYSAYATGTGAFEEKGNEDSVVADFLLQEDRDAVLVDFEFFEVEFEDNSNVYL